MTDRKKSGKTGTKTARKPFDAAAWVAKDPSAAPSRGQIFALLMPSKGGLNTGSLRATEAAERLAAMGLPCWTRKGLAQVNDAIRSDKGRREDGQKWLTGLLTTTATVVKTVEVPAEVEEAQEAPTEVEEEFRPQDQLIAALASKTARLEAEITRLREGKGRPDEIPAGMVFVAGHLRRRR